MAHAWRRLYDGPLSNEIMHLSNNAEKSQYQMCPVTQESFLAHNTVRLQHGAIGK